MGVRIPCPPPPLWIRPCPSIQWVKMTCTATHSNKGTMLCVNFDFLPYCSISQTKTLMRLHGNTGWSEPCLLTDVTSTNAPGLGHYNELAISAYIPLCVKNDLSIFLAFYMSLGWLTGRHALSDQADNVRTNTEDFSTYHRMGK